MIRNEDRCCDTATNRTKPKRDFHRQVRVVYRACRKLYGKEKTQDECLKVFKIVFPELYRLRNSTDEYVGVPRKITDGLILVTHDWNPHGVLCGVISHAIGQLQMSLDWKREELMQFYEDIMPVCMRIRKLTPSECLKLMGCDDSTIHIMLNCGLSNSSLYRLAGNSIVVDVMVALFDKLFINTEQERQSGTQLTLF